MAAPASDNAARSGDSPWQPVVRSTEGSAGVGSLTSAPPGLTPWAPVPAVETRHAWFYAQIGRESPDQVHPYLQGHITAKWAWRSWWVAEGAEQSLRGARMRAQSAGRTKVEECLREIDVADREVSVGHPLDDPSGNTPPHHRDGRIGSVVKFDVAHM